MVMTSTRTLPPSGRAITTPPGGRLQIGMAEIKSESVADFIRNRWPTSSGIRRKRVWRHGAVGGKDVSVAGHQRGSPSIWYLRPVRDAGYQGPRVAEVVARTGAWTLPIVKRGDAHRFVILPKPSPWISRNVAWAGDFERYSRTVAAFFRLAMIRIMLRRLTRPTHSA